MGSSFLVYSFLYGYIVSILSFSFSLNHKIAKNLNLSLSSQVVIGSLFSVFFARKTSYNAYWGLPTSFIICGIINTVSFYLINRMRNQNRTQLEQTLALLSVGVILTAFSNEVYLHMKSQWNVYGIYGHLKDFDFSLFDSPGVLFVMTSLWFLTIILSRVNNSDLVGNKKWFTWFLCGGLSGLVGSMLVFWFIWTGNDSLLLAGMIAGSLLGGFDSPFLGLVGGFIVGFSEIGFLMMVENFPGWVGLLVGTRPFFPVFVVFVVLLFFPKGLSGVITRTRKDH